MSIIPHVRSGIWPQSIPAVRAASMISRDDPAGCTVAIIGLADDLGVRMNHGRTGAREGPTAFRAALARYGVAQPHGWDWPRIFDAGDIIPAEGNTEEALTETHNRITEATTALTDLGLFPIAIGGGHDLTFPFVRGITARWPRLAGVYFDPHLDVRESAGSGMPFRRLLETGKIPQLQIYGFSPLINTREHVTWFESHGGEIMDAPPSLGSFPSTDFFLSFDLDVLDAAHAPGVSALNPSGWSPSQAQAAVAAAARHPGIRCFDIMELCPAHDPDGRTARLAVHLFLTFVRARAERSS